MTMNNPVIIGKVLSLFDGMSCGQTAFKRAGIKVVKYFASEIDKYAIQTTQKNYPDTIQLGDVRDVKGCNFSDIDLLMAGSPCTGFSFAGKGLNFDDPQSVLFFEFLRLLKEIKPKNFLLENVKMKQEHQDVISRLLGYQPILINSADYSAQNRERLYWTDMERPKKTKCDVSLVDILENEVPEKYFIKPKQAIKLLDKETEKGKIGYIRTDSQSQRIYSIYGKSITINAGHFGGNTGLYVMGCLTPDRIEKRQNGRRFKPPKNKSHTLTAVDRHGVLILQRHHGYNKGGIKAKDGKTTSLTTSSWDQNNLLLNGRIRRLTPVECERLQTVPDGYTEGVSDTQRYKMLGNGWTVDVIADILRNIGTKTEKQMRLCDI